MDLVFVDTFTSSERINVFHYCMFHGEDERTGVTFPNSPSHSLEGDLSEPILLSRNGTVIPDIFMPSTTLIVSAGVKEKLESLPNVVFLNVVFKKLVDYPYAADDFSYFQRPEYRRDPRKEDPETLIRRLPDCPALHRKSGAYFELVTCNAHVAKKEFRDLARVTFLKPDLGEFVRTNVALSREMITKYPILWAEGGILFTEDAFARIRNHFDLAYFTITKVQGPT
jgi:hypothetical protein